MHQTHFSSSSDDAERYQKPIKEKTNTHKATCVEYLPYQKSLFISREIKLLSELQVAMGRRYSGHSSGKSSTPGCGGSKRDSKQVKLCFGPPKKNVDSQLIMLGLVGLEPITKAPV